jgi:hypothetical protein
VRSCRDKRIHLCFGLSKSKLYKADSGLQSLIRSVAYLLQGAIFRPRYATTTPSDSTRYGRQHVTVVFLNTSTSLEYRRKWGDRWTLRVSEKSIQEGDVICLLQGASKPTIIRRRRDFPRDFLLAWNWDESLPNLQDQTSDESSIGISGT